MIRHLAFYFVIFYYFTTSVVRCEVHMNFAMTEQGALDEFYNVQFHYSTGDRYFIFGHSLPNNRYFIREVLPDGKVGIVSDEGQLDDFYEVMFHYNIGDEDFLYSHSSYTKNYNIRRLTKDGKMGARTDGSRLYNFFGSNIPFTIDGKTYLYSQSRHENIWVITNLLSDGTNPPVHVDAGTMTNFYNHLTIFTIDGDLYLYGLSNDDWKVSIRELKSGGKLGPSIHDRAAASTSEKDYTTNLFTISLEGKEYLFGQNPFNDYWYIREFDGNRLDVGNVVSDGYWDKYYAVHFPIYIGNKVYLYRQNYNGKWSIHELTTCTTDAFVQRRSTSRNYHLAAWNMQGRLEGGDGDNKWTLILLPWMRGLRGARRVDVMALQECGSLPRTTRSLADRAPETYVDVPNSTGNDQMEITQNLWGRSLETDSGSRQNDFYVYHVANVQRNIDNQRNDRTELAIVSVVRADEVLVVGPGGAATRPMIGIRIGNDFFFSLHAGAHENNEVPVLMAALDAHMRRRIQFNPDITYTVLGDFNRVPRALGLDRPPRNVNRQVARPQHATQGRAGLLQRVLDYAIVSGRSTDIQVDTSTSGSTISDHIIVFFLLSLQRERPRCG